MSTKVESFLKSALKKCADFYEITEYQTPNLVLLKDRKAINSLCKANTEDWLVGWYENETLFLLAPESYESESSHKYSDLEYSRLITHEVSHFFYSLLTSSPQPIWLDEGLSVYLSNQYKTKKLPEKFEQFLKYFDYADENVYAEAGHAIKLLVNTFGKEKIIKFIKSLGKGEPQLEIEKKFQENFDHPLSYETFNNLLNRI